MFCSIICYYILEVGPPPAFGGWPAHLRWSLLCPQQPQARRPPMHCHVTGLLILGGREPARPKKSAFQDTKGLGPPTHRHGEHIIM